MALSCLQGKAFLYLQHKFPQQLKQLLAAILFVTCLQLQAQDSLKVKIGGALRFNYNYSTWKPNQKQRGGDFGYDMARINAEASYKGISMNFEYRLYAQSFGGGMLKQGWFAYSPSEQVTLQMGLTQVPFGITQYNSNNWFFSLNYYMGLEDDHDMGIKYSRKTDNWLLDIAFFKNAEELNFGNNSDLSYSRYSYDISSIDLNGDGQFQYRNKEINQLNFKLVRKIKTAASSHQIGLSMQYGGIFNLDLNKNGHHSALAAHYELNYKHWHLKAQWARFDNKPKTFGNDSPDVMAMAAYGAPYLVATSSNNYTLGLSYSIDVDWKPISNLLLYNDFGMMDKTKEDFADSFMNVTGVLVTAGNLFTYIDFAQGKNQPWLGPEWTDALAQGDANAKWEMRFNINFGYYF